MKTVLVSLLIPVILIAGIVTFGVDMPDKIRDEQESNVVLYRYDYNRTGTAPFVSNIKKPHVKWIFQTSGDALSSPLIADVNKDGKEEIVVGGDDGQLYVIDQNGTLLYSAFFRRGVPMMPAAADIDGDGRLEIVWGQGTHSYGGSLDIYAVNGEDLSLIWNYTSISVSNHSHGFFASPMFHDSNGDGLLDVLIGSMDDYFYAFNGLNGSVIWKSPKSLHYIRTTSPMNDIDNDGYEEIISLDNAALIRVHDANTGYIEWEKQLGYGVGSSPLIADLDGDGYAEIATFMVVSGGVSVLNHDGSVLWNNTTVNDFYTSPTIAYVDDDLLPDLIGGDYWNHTLLAFRGFDGTPLWQTVIPNNTWAQSLLVTADIDGDGEIEVLAQGKERDLLSVNARTGEIEWTFHVERPFGQPTVWDIDRDGVAEIVLSAGGGLVYVLEQAPEPNFAPRTIGYWKHQCKVEEPKENHPGITDEFVSAIAENSSVFAGVQSHEEVCDILLSNPKSNMTGKALRQLMALWLNIVSGIVDTRAGIDLGNLSSARTVGEAIAEIEDILLHSSEKSEVERAKDIADALNNGMR
ncbi:MAG: FG-GAP-like repeat-containing protein [Candidatus Bathyarchaeia archaeon]